MLTRRPAALALALIVSAWTAHAVAEEAPAAKPDTAPESERVICKDEASTGSHLRRERRCATQAEWDRRREADQKAVGDMGSRGRQNAPQGN